MNFPETDGYDGDNCNKTTGTLARVGNVRRRCANHCASYLPLVVVSRCPASNICVVAGITSRNGRQIALGTPHDTSNVTQLVQLH
jgi:hypothetical protein